ncbi:uncharacterized protein SEPMUDRAFT_13804, partial [Sphaerulina musiva SO2202]
MKAALTTLLLCVGAVSAIAVAEPVANADPKKKKKAQSGRKAYQGRFGFCGVAGSNCARMKRSAEAIADAFAEADPDARYQGRFGFCGVAGSNCHKARRAIEHIGELAERSYSEIETRSGRKAYQGRFGFCGVAGSNCKRDAEAEADPKKKKKAQSGRTAYQGRFGFCGVAGSNCAMVKRDARYQGRFGFCGVAGSNCKRDADVEAVANIARAIEEWDPTYLAEVCHSEGGECSALVKAHRAFKQIKRDTE